MTRRHAPPAYQTRELEARAAREQVLAVMATRLGAPDTP